VQSKPFILQASTHFARVDGGDVVANDHDRQAVANYTLYTDPGERLAQRIVYKFVDRLPLCCGGLRCPLVQFIVYR
jgi:hypothetical protein